MGPRGSQYGGLADTQEMAPLSSQPTQYAPPPITFGDWPGQPPGPGYVAPPSSSWALSPWAPHPAAPSSGFASQGPGIPAAAPGQRRRMPGWQRVLLAVLAILLVLVGVWIIIARPIIHQNVDSQIQQGLQSAVDQIFPLPPGIEASGQQLYDQNDLNNYLAQRSSQLAPLTDFHVSLQPNLLVATFKIFGLGSTIQFGLYVRGGALQATDVSVSGLLSWVESADELTPRLNNALGQINGRLGRQFTAVQITSGKITIDFTS